MEDYQQASCDKCNSPEFEYDGAWKEYSCKNCGWIVKDPEKISAIRKAEKFTDESTEKYSNKEASLLTQDVANDKQTTIAPLLSSKQKNDVDPTKDRDKIVRPGEKDLQHNLLQSLFNNDNEALKNKAIKNLVIEANPTTVQELGRVLYDKNASNRKLAANTLQKIEKARKDLLERFLKGEEKDSAKVEMAKASFSTIQSLKFVLIQNLSAKDNSIRKLSAQAMEKLQDEKAVEPLIHLLRDKDVDIREIAAEALGANIKKQHLERLTAMLNDESNGVRWYIGVALKSFYKSEMKALMFIIPISILAGLFAFFAGSLIGKTSGGLDLGGILQGVAGLLWFASVVCALYVLPKYGFRIARVNKRIKGLDMSG